MKLKFFLCVTLLVFQVTFPSVLTVYNNRPQGKSGTFIGAQYPKGWSYHRSPNGGNIKHDLGAGKIDSIRWFQEFPEKTILYQANINQPGIFLPGGVLEIVDDQGGFYYYANKKNPNKGNKKKAAEIKTWKVVEENKLAIINKSSKGIFVGTNINNDLVLRALKPNGGRAVIDTDDEPASFIEWHDIANGTFYKGLIRLAGAVVVEIFSDGKYDVYKKTTPEKKTRETASVIKEWKSK